MRTLIVYESMYGNTHVVAQAIAEGMRPRGEVHVVPVGDATEDEVAWADIVVVGGPTHAHGMTSSASRKGAVDAVTKPDSTLHLDPDAEGPGLRTWFDALGPVTQKHAAAFDTRFEMSAILTGRASRGISHRLRKHGFTLVADQESFFVDRQTALIDGEAERATKWGEQLAHTYEWPPAEHEPGYHEGVGRTP